MVLSGRRRTIDRAIARLRRSSPSLLEASADLGAHGSQTFRYITFPAIRSAMLAGALLAFALSFDEVVCSVPRSGSAPASQALTDSALTDTAFTAGATLEETPHFTFHEVEIEALDDESGETASLATLEEVAAAVMELLPLTRSSTSKLERATTLLGPFIEDKFGGR